MWVPGDFDGFCRRVWDPMVRAVELYCGDAGLAEEAVQEALARAWDRWDEVSGMASPDGWVYRVAVNVTRSWFRRVRTAHAARQRLADEARRGYGQSDPALRLAVWSALQELSDAQREAVIARFYLGMSAVDTAALLGTSAQAIRARTHRALRSLQGRLDVEFSELSGVEDAGETDHAL